MVKLNLLQVDNSKGFMTNPPNAIIAVRFYIIQIVM